MKVGETASPVLAALSAVSAVGTLACCLPIAGASFLGLGGLFGALGAYQQWLLPASGVCLALGTAQVWHSRRVCHRTSWVSVTILALSAVIVLLVLFAPQTVSSALADWLS